MRRMAWMCLWLILVSHSAAAQGVSLDLDGLLAVYGDNTEFSNQFREGETLIGAFARLFAEARVNDRLAIRAGVIGNQRFGADRSFEQVRPVLAIVVGGARSQLIFGTLDTPRLDDTGPDRTGPHGLLPPVQRETLAFERPWEAGLQWTVSTPRISQDSWVHWQRLNTRDEREQFDAGVANRIRLRPSLTLRTDAHIVHQGGQLSANGPVADSWAVATGIDSGGAAGWVDRVSLEAFALVSRFVPDRERQDSNRTGFGTFIRIAAEEGPWRVHGILWRASDFIKQEGDAHYGALRRDLTQFRALRDYAEAGLTRTFRPAAGAFVESSVRWHRVEDRYEYSFRLLAVVRLRERVK